jgi:hypothetical protein
MNRFRFFFFLFVVLFTITGHAVTVEKFTFVPRQAGLFVGTVRTAFNSKTGATLVIYDRNNGTVERHAVWGRLISPTGTPSGSAFPIVKGPNAQFADVTYNPDDNQFLLVYANETNGPDRFEIFAQKLKPTGRRLGKRVRISPAADHGEEINNAFPRVVYDSKTQGYFVIWRRHKRDTNVQLQDGLYGTTLNPDLTERNAPVLMTALIGDFTNILGPFITDIGFHPTNGKLLIAGWSQSAQPGFSVQYFLARADATLKKAVIKLTKLKRGLSSGAAPHAELAFLPGNNVEGLFVEGTGVRKRKINLRGAPAGPDSFFFTGALQTVPLEFPVAALATANGRAETAVVGIEDSSTQTGKVWLQTANAAGSAVGQPFELQSNLDIGASPAVIPLPDHPQTGFLFGVIYVEGVRKNPPTPNDSSGLVLLKVNTTP